MVQGLGFTVEVGGLRVLGLYHGQELPRPLDSLLFEVLGERPVAEHLEEGVVVHVLAHL